MYAHDSDSDFDEPYDSKTSFYLHNHDENVLEARVEAPMATLSIPHYSDEATSQSGEGR